MTSPRNIPPTMANSKMASQVSIFLPSGYGSGTGRPAPDVRWLLLAPFAPGIPAVLAHPALPAVLAGQRGLAAPAGAGGLAEQRRRRDQVLEQVPQCVVLQVKL